MKTRKILIIGVVLLLFLSCAPKVVIPPAPEEIGTQEQLFLRAEKLFHAKSYYKALDTYGRYLSSFPDGQFADHALMKTGMIYVSVKKNRKAREVFNRLLSEYPNSPLVYDARIEILATYYNEEKFSQVIQLSSSLLESKISKVKIGRIYTILGDTYVAMDSPEDSIYFYAMADKMFEGLEKDSIIVKLKEAISRLDSQNVLSLLNYIEDDLPKRLSHVSARRDLFKRRKTR